MLILQHAPHLHIKKDAIFNPTPRKQLEPLINRMRPRFDAFHPVCWTCSGHGDRVPLQLAGQGPCKFAIAASRQAEQA